MTERLADDLATALNRKIGQPLASGLTLTGWRFDMHRIAQAEIGLKDSRLGGPYTAPSFKEELGGEIFLHWNGARYSSGHLDRLVLQEFDEHWELWQRTAYQDENGPDLMPPFQPPEIPLMDEAVRAIVSGGSPLPFELLVQSLDELKSRFGAEKIDGRFKAGLDRRTIRNSLGMDVSYEQSPVDLFLEADDLFGEAFAEKRLPTEAEVVHLKTYIGETLNFLKQEGTLPAEGKMPVLLPPSVTEAFCDHYLTANLQGMLVANRQSAFRPEDFQNNRQVLRGDISVSLDGTRPFRRSSYRCTGEGVPTGKADLIEAGRLKTPILNLKYAKRLGMKPTPIPAGGGSVLLRAPTSGDMEELYRSVDRCLIVYSILGLHTQDFSSGDFSLTADQCLWVEKGEVRCKVKAVIAGNFLRALSAQETRFAYSPWDDNPACLFLADVSR